MKQKSQFFQLYLSFKGRINRLTFWIYGVLVLNIVSISGILIDFRLIGEPSISYFIVNVIVLIPGLALNVKRCHDRDHTGWFILIILIPVIGAIWYFIEIGLLKGSSSENRFGEPPGQLIQLWSEIKKPSLILFSLLLIAFVIIAIDFTMGYMGKRLSEKQGLNNKQVIIPIEEIEDIPGFNDMPTTAIRKIPPAPPPPPESSSSEPQYLSDEIVPFTLLDELAEIIGGADLIQKNLIYPEEARDKRIEGKVVIIATIGQTGELVETRILKSSNKILDGAALEAVRSVKWIPAQKDGKAVKSKLAIPVYFHLK